MIAAQEPAHGTIRRYRWRQDPCREACCREANAEAQRQRRRRQGKPGGRFIPAQHGTRACYTGGCRRPECVKANRDYVNEYNRLRREGISMSDPWVEQALK